jgi:hypothetical protein
MTRPRCMTALVTGLTLVLSSYLSVAAQAPGLKGAVQLGNCDTVADWVSDLTPSRLATGERRGNREAVPATTSFSTIPISLDALLAEDHVVTVASPASDVVACGEVGGRRTDAGALIIGLRPEEASDIMGIAYLAPSGDASQTDISLFVAGDPLATMAMVQADEVAQAVPEAIAEAGGVDVPLTPLPRAEPDVAAPVAEQPTGFSPEEAAYASDLAEIIQSQTESFNEFVLLTENPRIGQDDWTIQVATVFAIWELNYQEVQALTPPPVFVETHALVVEAFRLYSEAGHDGAVGIDTLDPALINQASTKMDHATELLILAKEEVERIQQERGG